MAKGIGGVVRRPPMDEEEQAAAVASDQPVPAEEAPPEEDAQEEAEPMQEPEPQGGIGGAAARGGTAEGEAIKPEASPEEQEEYDKIMSNAFKIIYPEGGEEASPQIMKVLQSEGKPVANLAAAAVAVISGMRASAKQSGEVDRWNQIAEQGDLLNFDEILFNVGEAVVGELAELSEAAKVHDYSEQEMEAAFYAGLDMYRQQAGQTGDLDPEVLKQGWNQLVEADKAGQAEQMMPGIGERMRKAESEPAAEEAM